MRFVREKKITAGEYLDVEVYTYTTEQLRRLPRARRRKVSPPKIIAQNDKNALRRFIALVNANFSGGGYRLDTTYADAPDPVAAEKDRQKLIRRLKYLYKSRGCEFRYISVTEGGRPKPDGTYTRIHHHILIGDDVPRDDVEACWKLGRVSCQKLQPSPRENGLEPLARYLLKHQRTADDKNACRWSGSKNLRKPVEAVSDKAYTLGETARLWRAQQDCTLNAKLERRYKGYEVIACSADRNRVTGFIEISAQLHRRI